MHRSLDVMMRWWRGAIGRGNGHANGNGHGHINGNGAATSETPAPCEETRSVEPPWLAQLDREGIPRSLHYPTTTLARLIDQAAERFGDQPALIYNQKRWTYRELLAGVNRMAGGLSRLGVRKGDRVVLTLPNCPEYVTAFFAIQKLGAVVVNAGPLMGRDDLRSLLALVSPHVVIGLDLQVAQLINAAKDSPPAHFVWVTLQSYQTLLKRLGYQFKLWHGREHPTGSAEHVTLANLLENAPAKPPTIEPAPDATAVLQPTSGTTGLIKLAQLSHRNLLANAMQVAVWMGAHEGQERVLTVLPMFHVYGLTTGLINPIFCAATITLLTRFDAVQTLDVLEQQHPTVFPLVPAICDALSNEIERRQRQNRPAVLHGLRICISGAAPLPREFAERFERLTGARTIEGYGLSESSPVTHANPQSRPRYGSIGLPMPDTMCRVVDLDDCKCDVAMGQPGELLVSGPQIMSGYYKNPQETQHALWTDEHGKTWLRTGDVVRMDEDGFFQVLDRKKDMIIRSGLKVYPAKVERVLRTDARVADVAVIGRADPQHTEEVVAFVALKSAAADQVLDHATLTSELRALCRQHLAAYEVPAAFEFIDQIPRSALGKTLKRELRQRPAGGVAAAADADDGGDTPTKPHRPEKERKAA